MNKAPHRVTIEASATFGHAQRAAKRAAEVARYGFERPVFVVAPPPSALARTVDMLARALRVALR